jgi:hypothetical protein
MFTGKNHVISACCPARGLTMIGGSLPTGRQARLAEVEILLINIAISVLAI